MAQVNENMMLSRQTSSLMRAMDAFNESIMLVDTDSDEWNIMFINDAWIRMLGARFRLTLNPKPRWGRRWRICTLICFVLSHSCVNAHMKTRARFFKGYKIRPPLVVTKY